MTESDSSAAGAAAGRRVLRNFGLLLGGRATGAVVGLAATALTARGLSPAAFGTVVVIHTYVLLFQGLFNPHSFEAVVRYGVHLREPAGLSRLLRGFLRLDVAGALAGFVGAAGAAPLAGELLGWSAREVGWTMVYSAVIAFSPVATMIGILRLYDRFDLLALQATARHVVRIAGVGTAYAAGAGAVWYLAAWLAGLLVEQLWLLGWGRRELRRRLGALQRPPAGQGALSAAHPGIWRFAAGAYGQGQLDLANKHLLTLLAGGVLGPQGAGLYRLAREIAKAIAWPVVLLREALLPDLARLWPDHRQRFVRLTLRACLASGVPGIALWLAVHLYGGALLSGLAGAAYTAAAPLMSLLIGAATLELIGSPLRPAAFAMGYPELAFRISLAALAVNVGLLLAVTPALGLIGPGIAALAAAALGLIGLSAVFLTLLRRSRPRAG